MASKESSKQAVYTDTLNRPTPPRGSCNTSQEPQPIPTLTEGVVGTDLSSENKLSVYYSNFPIKEPFSGTRNFSHVPTTGTTPKEVVPVLVPNPE